MLKIINHINKLEYKDVEQKIKDELDEFNKDEELRKIIKNIKVITRDFIKDDEKMMNPAYCRLGIRVKKVSAALKHAEEETGQK